MDPIDPSLQYYPAMEDHPESMDLAAYQSLAAAGEQYGEEDDHSPASGAKRRKKSEGNEGTKAKKSRSSQSCDACRARKVRCDRPPPGTLPADSALPTKDTCSHCQHLGIECTFLYRPKKRGPPNQYLRKLQDESPSSGSPSAPPQISKQYAAPRFPTFETPSYDRAEPYHEPPDTSYAQAGPGPGTLAEQRASHASALTEQGSGSRDHRSNGRDVEADWEPTLLMAIRSTAPSAQPSHPSNPSNQSLIGPASYHGTPATHLSTVSPHSSSIGHSPIYNYQQGSFLNHTHDPNNPFDAILPRPLLHHIIELYFDYIYGLTPCIHRPSFLRDLDTRREERPNEEEWRSLVFSVVTMTLVQLPRSFIPLPRSEIRNLAEKCRQIAKDYLNQDFQDITTNRLVIGFLITYASHILGHDLYSMTLAGANLALLLKTRLYAEQSYNDLNPLEREMRRRIFWLLAGGVTTWAITQGTPSMTNEMITSDARLPSRLDDEYFDELQYMSQPDDVTSSLSGFYYISKLFRISGEILAKRHRDRIQPPSGVLLQIRINEINESYDEVMSLMDDCPACLRLDMDNDGQSASGFSEDWNSKALKDVESIFLDPKANRAALKDAFLAQQANIYVTQQMVRYMALQHRDDLLALQNDELAKSHGPSRKQSGSRRSEWSRVLFSKEEKEEVASDLLTILQKIPIQVIAVNSAPLVDKVRFVASTLLDALNGGVEGDNNEGIAASARVQKAQSYLWNFLKILSEIEALYSMSDDA